MKIEYNYSKELGEFLSRQGVEEALYNQKQDILDEIKKKIKKKTASRQLIHFDRTVEYIKYFENDSDPAYNEALKDVKNIINNLK